MTRIKRGEIVDPGGSCSSNQDLTEPKPKDTEKLYEFARSHNLGIDTGVVRVFARIQFWPFAGVSRVVRDNGRGQPNFYHCA